MTIATPTIGQDFAARMERLGLTQTFLAEYTGLSQSAISKTVNELTDSQRTRINEALRELENVAEFFRPMKPLFDDAGAVKRWLASPSLPNLFALLSDAQLKKLDTTALTAVNAIYAEGEKLEAEIAAINEATRKTFLDWLENPSGR